MVNKEKSTVAADVMTTAKNKNVKFIACEVALKRNQVEPGMLVSGVSTVPDGIYEIVQRQHEGWGYIKASR